jgi:biopolymer transport protein ExbB
MTKIFEFIRDSGFVGWCIVGVGFLMLGISFERFKALFYNYTINADEFMGKIQTLILAKKTDEALLLCGQLESKPLANAFKKIIEKSDQDDESIFQAHDIALSENIPLYNKRTHYLSMLANVSTLLGLLGTIEGLIVSFAAVAQADPAAKQAMLAHGISVSMYTTALGLVVAIPAMVLFSFLVSKQNAMIEQTTEKCGKLTELLTSTQSAQFGKEQVYRNEMPQNNSVKPPSTNIKAS